MTLIAIILFCFSSFISLHSSESGSLNSDISENKSTRLLLTETYVLVHPEMNTNLILDTIKNAKNRISFSALSVPTRKFAEEIVSAQKRGVEVYLIITNPFYEVGFGYEALSKKFETDIETLKNMKNRLARDLEFLNVLTDNNIYPHYINREYYINHQKLLIVDDTAFISTSPNFEKRDFSIIIHEIDQVEALQEFFFQDYLQIKNNAANLERFGFVVGPENQREKLEDLLRSAKISVHLYAADFNDLSICSIVEDLLLKGVKIYVLNTPHFFGFNEQSLNTAYYLKRIKQFGAEIKIVRQPFIHSKIIMVDVESEENRKMYFGSCNIFSNSIDHTRELGLITKSINYINPVFSSFLIDWKRGADL
jgi:phosphatidylserine/phosphatidylglycerophosphate/cardiolipin synthase-like enzyme